jgi:hypothetical protein
LRWIAISNIATEEVLLMHLISSREGKGYELASF